eukprot:c8464_g1_i1.p1 GENE.c8464_g1_i1~~c8464_g1_i1.p1  ORF type:complete len:471 (-),score=108.89 c8464_g1_i1:383-1762(-)
MEVDNNPYERRERREGERDRERDRGDRDRGDRDRRDSERRREERPRRDYDRERSDRDRERHERTERDRHERTEKEKERKRSPSPTPEEELAPLRRYTFRTGWDVLPAGMEALATHELLNPQLMSLLPPTAQQTRQARRLYVGNVPPGVSELALMDFFNKTMMDANATVMEGRPILNVEVNLEKNFAFMEFRTPEEASACIHFDGISFEGNTLRIRRPKDYAGGSMIGGATLSMMGVQVPDTPNKVFVGGLPSYFGDEQVQELLLTVGPLKHFNLIRDQTTGISKGYAFCEWMDDQTTDRACAALNGIQVGEKTLIVQRSNSALRAAAQQQGGLSTQGGIAPHPMNMVGVTGVASAVPGASSVPTCILLLLNMVTQQELEDDEEYQDIVADIEEECSKYGKVTGVLIPRPPAPGVGKVFVEFDQINSALDAQAALEGRKFASRIINAAFFTEEAYHTRSF